MSACKNGHVEVVDKLLQHGARPDLQNEVMNTLLHNINPFLALVNMRHASGLCKTGS